MPAPPRRVASRRSGRNLLVLFGVSILLPGALLTMFGVRAMLQERRFVDQQLRERLDRAADAALREVEREVRSWRAALDHLDREGFTGPAPAPLGDALDDPGGAVVARFGGQRAFWPREQLLFDSLPDQEVTEPPYYSADFAAAEQVELRQRDYARAARAYQRLLDPAPRAARTIVLHRLARTLRKAGREEEALRAYRQLAEAADLVGAVPAALVARHEMGAILAEQGQADGLRTAALDLYADLAGGRWRLEKARYLHYVAAARGWLDRVGGDATAAALVRIEEKKRALTEAVEHHVRSGDGSTSSLPRGFVLIRASSSGSVYAIVSQPWLATRRLPEALRTILGEGFDVSIGGADGSVWFNSAPLTSAAASAEAFVATRVAEGPDAPWRVRVHPRDPALFAADLVRRQRTYLLMVAMVTVLLLVGAHVTARAVRRELHVAKLQADFVSTVSHEFRSPLTGIRQLAELLARGRVPSEERRHEYYGRIARETNRLTRLVENLLDFSQMEEGTKSYRFERIETASWLQTVVEDARARRDAALPRVIGRVASGLPCIEADPEALASAVHNLIDNAVKYSPGRDAVWVNADVEDGEVAIRVRDEGVGIDERDRERVFEKFYRGEGEITRHVKGAGLGLSLAAHIVRAHGGRIECDSRVGAGSTFTVRLRAAGPAVPGLLAPGAEQQVG